jgi:hypothetical protein
VIWEGQALDGGVSADAANPRDRVASAAARSGPVSAAQRCRLPRHRTNEWLSRGGVMLPIYQREPMWLSFDASEPTACRSAQAKCARSADCPGSSTSAWTRKRVYITRLPPSHATPWAAAEFVRWRFFHQMGHVLARRAAVVSHRIVAGRPPDGCPAGARRSAPSSPSGR